MKREFYHTPLFILHKGRPTCLPTCLLKHHVVARHERNELWGYGVSNASLVWMRGISQSRYRNSSANHASPLLESTTLMATYEIEAKRYSKFNKSFILFVTGTSGNNLINSSIKHLGDSMGSVKKQPPPCFNSKKTKRGENKLRKIIN